jgi:AraC-like DNA-binding protein
MAAGSIAQVRRVCEYIHTHLASDIGVAELASQVNLSPHHFSMLFKHALGVPPHQYILQARIREAQRQLATGRVAISEVALRLGFSDQSHFSRAFRKVTGTTPARMAASCRVSSLTIRVEVAQAAVAAASSQGPVGCWGSSSLKRDPPGHPPPATE